MRIFNTYSRETEEIKAINPPTVTVYTCGPTVYDFAHVGHWFNYVRMDMLIRGLISSGLRPKWVMNITDVGHLTSDQDEGQDKLQEGADREGKSAWEIAEFYTKDFLEGMKLLNILDPDYIVKATDHIKDQIELIKKLEEKGFTYEISDGIYYDTSKFPKYAEFARLDLDEQQAGVRVEVNPEKKQPTDFALWKFSPIESHRDMEWDSPWGKGFPGWHIECSAMSMKYLGDTLDIHTGGIDHIPIHHTNEIAQSEAVTGKPLANYWMHSNHVLIDNQKISKSLGNGIKLTDVIEKGYSPEVLRLHILESNYKSHSKFSWDSLEAAKNRLNNLKSMAALKYQTKEAIYDGPTFSLEDVPTEIANLLQDDLNTPAILAFLSDVTTQLLSTHLQNNMLDHFEIMINGIDNLLGLKLNEIKDISNEQKHLLKEREEARKNNEWDKSDNIRLELENQNIGLNDTKYGPIWYPIN
jgi:cysteinyl-tRNA synthetase